MAFAKANYKAFDVAFRVKSLENIDHRTEGSCRGSTLQPEFSRFYPQLIPAASAGL